MQTLRLILELLYFASGVALAIAAFIGLRQLTIAKDNAKMSAKREAYKLAAEQCSLFLSHLIPLYNKLDHSITERKIQFFDKAKVEVDNGQITVRLGSDKSPYEEIAPVAREVLDVLNGLESFSLFFVSGVADEKVAFSSVGTTYLNTVRRLLPLIVAVTKDEKHFRSIVRLFLIWNARRESEKLLLSKGEIEERLKTIANKTINPLGT